MNVPRQAQIDELVRSIRESAKYRTISEDLIRGIGLHELQVRRGFKEAVKATKNKLHQIAGAYLDSRPRYADWLEKLGAAAESDDGDRLRQACVEIMGFHASTRERIPILNSFYATALADAQPIRSVLDVACGLNPLAIPWMPLATDTTYIACDIYTDMMDFLQAFFGLAGIRGHARVCDLITAPPRQQVDLALVLKAIPPLEQVDKSAGLTLLQSLNARHLLVSYPAQSLGGRSKGMVENYEAHFRALVADEPWTVQRFEFATELAFLVRK